MFRKLLTILLFSTMLVSTGCEMFNPIGPIIQLGVMWYEGEASKYYNTDQETIHIAVKKVLNDLEFPITKETNEGDYIYIIADADDRFKIKVREVRHNVTKLSIRINTWGDRPYAEMIFRHVDREPKVIDFVTVEELNTALQERKRVRHNK